MLRLRPSKIDITNRDIEWHYERSAGRIIRDTFNSEAEFRNEDQQLRRLSSGEDERHIPTGIYARVTSNAIPFPIRRLAKGNPELWEHTLIQSRPIQSPDDSSPRLPFPVASSSRRTASNSSMASSSADFETGGEERDIPSSVDPNVRAADELEAEQARVASRPPLDGTTDLPEITSHDIALQHIPLAYRSLNSHHTLSIPLPRRLRNISGTVPALGSPLRYAEAAQSSSPERQSAPNPLGGAHRSPEHRVTVAHHNEQRARPTSPSAESSVQASYEDDLTSPVRQRLERFSPASDADLRRLSDSFYISRPATISRPGSESSVLEYSVTATPSNGETTEASLGDIAPESPVAHRTPRSIFIYDDDASPNLQPQTPVGLPHDEFRELSTWNTSLNDWFHPVPRTPARLASRPGVGRYESTAQGDLILRNRNSGGNLDLQRREPEQQEEDTGPHHGHLLEETPPRAPRLYEGSQQRARR